MSRETGVSPECPTCGHDSEHYDVPGVHACEACEQGADDAAEEYAGEGAPEHTAERWALEAWGDRLRVIGPNNQQIADIWAPDAEMRDHARLIAAAPSLYEALRAFASFDLMQLGPEEWTDLVTRARAAIQLAEGDDASRL